MGKWQEARSQSKTCATTATCIGTDQSRSTPTRKEISSTREAAQAGTTTIVEATAVDTRKVVGRETDTTREIETENDSVAQTAQEIEPGIVAATETESTTRKRGGQASNLITSLMR